jgi:uncharacterized protein (DUF362 family)
MIVTGPLGGQAVETGLVIASRDPVAAEVVGARLLGFRPRVVHHLWEASQLGLSGTDTVKQTFPVLDLQQAIETFTEAVFHERLTFEHA